MVTYHEWTIIPKEGKLRVEILASKKFKNKVRRWGINTWTSRVNAYHTMFGDGDIEMARFLMDELDWDWSGDGWHRHNILARLGDRVQDNKL